MKFILALTLSLFSMSVFADEIYKWKDKSGTVHFGSRPPSGEKTEVIASSKEAAKDDKKSTSNENNPSIDQYFLLGRWQSEQYTAYGTVIPVQVYVFNKLSQGVEGKAMTMPIKKYSVKGKIIIVEGGINQEFTVIDHNTVSYDTGGAGIKKLHRL